VTALRRKPPGDIRRRPGRSIAIMLTIVVSVGGLSCAERALSATTRSPGPVPGRRQI
jgi:hypothetical protein